jgi:hypothetical protein
MQWINDQIKAVTDEETGKVDFTKLNAAIKTEFPKYAVDKDQYNSQSNQLTAAKDKLKEAESTIDQLKKDNVGNDKLQEEIEQWKTKAVKADEKAAEADKKAAEANEKRKNQLIDSQAKMAMKDAKIKEKFIKYALQEIGELELDDEEKIIELQSKLDNFKENNLEMFEEQDDDDEPEEPKRELSGGYKVIDNSLPKGKKSEPGDPFKKIQAKYSKPN